MNPDQCLSRVWQGNDWQGNFRANWLFIPLPNIPLPTSGALSEFGAVPPSAFRFPLCLSSCSHTRSTRQPARRRARFTRASRALFAANFFAQNAAFPFGFVPCFGQPCQKQPSTNSARRISLNTKSGVTVSDGCRVTGDATGLRAFPATCHSSRASAPAFSNLESYVRGAIGPAPVPSPCSRANGCGTSTRCVWLG